MKAKALPEGSCVKLLEFLRPYRDAVQLVVDNWNISEKFSKKKLHRLFYSELRRLSFRAHHAKEIYNWKPRSLGRGGGHFSISLCKRVS